MIGSQPPFLMLAQSSLLVRSRKDLFFHFQKDLAPTLAQLYAHPAASLRKKTASPCADPRSLCQPSAPDHFPF